MSLPTTTSLQLWIRIGMTLAGLLAGCGRTQFVAPTGAAQKQKSAEKPRESAADGGDAPLTSDEQERTAGGDSSPEEEGGSPSGDAADSSDSGDAGDRGTIDGSGAEANPEDADHLATEDGTIGTSKPLCKYFDPQVPADQKRFVLRDVLTPAAVATVLGHRWYRKDGTPRSPASLPELAFDLPSLISPGDPRPSIAFVIPRLYYIDHPSFRPEHWSLATTGGTGAGSVPFEFIGRIDGADTGACAVSAEVSQALPRMAGESFDLSTLITMADGTQRLAGTLKAGDEVYNPETKGSSLVSKVVIGPEVRPMYRITLGKATLLVSEHHAFPTAAGLKPAHALTVDESLLDAEGNWHRIDSVKAQPLKVNQYCANIELVTGPAGLSGHVVVANGIVAGDLVMQRSLADILAARRGWVERYWSAVKLWAWVEISRLGIIPL